MAEEMITIELSKAEAIVLFEFVSEFSTKGQLKIADPAEQRVLWNICVSLESILAEPLANNYVVILEQARKDVRDKE